MAGSLPHMAAIVDHGVDPTVDVEALLQSPVAELLERAAARRDAAHGARVTFSPKVFIPLTMLCRDKCGYCTFAKPPAHLVSPYLELDEVLAIARRGAELGCHEALFTLGEAPEARYPDAAAWLADRGYASTVDYLVAAAAVVLTETGLLPHANAGALTEDELVRLRAVSPSQGMMIETLAARLGEPGGPHAGAPDKTPERRLATLEAAGRARVPFTTGILVGIGETRIERLEALLAIAAAHAAPRARAGGDRPELPAQAGHVDVARARVRSRRAPVDDRRRPAGARPVDPPAGAAQPVRARRPRPRWSRPGSTTGAASRPSPPTT